MIRDFSAKFLTGTVEATAADGVSMGERAKAVTMQKRI